MVILEYVENKNDIITSLNNFNKGARGNLDLATELFIRTTYWVYESSSNTYGPNKFVGYKNMTFDKYESALDGKFDGLLYFDAGGTRKVIERILGPYEFDDSLAESLFNWAELNLPPVLNGVNTEKWKFNHIN